MSNKMWGGRFTERPDAIMEEINVSIDVDRHLYAQDIAASKAHAAMLAAPPAVPAAAWSPIAVATACDRKSAIPATVPGTPMALYPSVEAPWMTLPLASLYGVVALSM